MLRECFAGLKATSTSTDIPISTYVLSAVTMCARASAMTTRQLELPSAGLECQSLSSIDKAGAQRSRLWGSRGGKIDALARLMDELRAPNSKA